MVKVEAVVLRERVETVIDAVEEETETAGLDVSEHGMWGYPEFYIPVPGGWNQSITTVIGERHDEYRQESAPPVVPKAEPEAA